MTSKNHSHSPANLDLFREKVAATRRQTGHLQRELADALGIDAQVLSRKLHGAKQAFPTHAEVKQIIKTLASWEAIATRAEAIDLLSLMGLKAESFSEQEWGTPPLNHLAVTPPTSPSASPAPQVFFPLPLSPTPLIGREQQTQLLLKQLQQPATRLLTLRGTGGVGKTRLALEVSHRVQHIFRHGVFFISFSTILDAALIPSTIVQALHLSEPLTESDPSRQTLVSHEDMIKDFLREKEILFVLDNVEQIPEIAPFISDLLSTTSGLKIMVTSRTVLHLYGEHEFEVPPLEVLSTGQASEHGIVLPAPAILLFVERAQAVHAGFQLTTQNAPTIAQICSRLDGLPLAIELAAVRTRVLSLPMILQRLSGGTGQGLSFLRTTARNTLQRHQTLYETLDWSYDLLDPQQQRLFRRLGVFLGGWTLDAAQAIAMDEGATLDDVLEQIEALLNHSLVKGLSSEEGSPDQPLYAEPRFHFLETIREYALLQLDTHGERATMQRQHASYYLALAEKIEMDLSGREQTQAVSLVAPEQDNLRAALSWAIERNEAEIAQRLCGALGVYWEARTQFQEAHRWIDTALKMQPTSPAIRAKLLMAASRLALWEIACERSRELALEALELYESVDDSEGKTFAIFQIGDTWHMQGEYALATKYFEECLPLQYEQKNWRSYAFTLSRLGSMATLQGNFAQAWQWLNEAAPLLREYSEPGLLNVTLVYLGILALVQGDLVQSMAYLREGLLLAEHIGNRYMLATDLIAFGCLLGMVREPSYAARICSAAESLFESLNTALPDAYRPLYYAYLGSLKDQVDEALWSIWWAEGKMLSQQELTSLVLLASESED